MLVNRLIIIFMTVYVEIFASNSCMSNCPETVKTIGHLGRRIACQLPCFDQFMLAVAYIAGLGFGVAAIFKFKQVKDNPTQIPISTPFALLGVSTLLVFLPGVIEPAGRTMFGSGIDEKSDVPVSSPDGSGKGMLFNPN